MTIKSDIKKNRSRLWYLLPIFLHIIGGVATYFLLKGSDPKIARNSLWLGVILSAIVTTVAVAVYFTYLNDISAAKERITTGSTIVNTAYGPIEYADVGQGNPVLAIHGTGGGFDQGLLTAESFLGEDIENTHRIIAPSRFGYLKTPMPLSSSDSDASPAAQADAYAALLDALGINQKVTVVGASAGALSATEFATKYPDRVSVLVLAIPAAWSPESVATESAQIGSNDFIMNTVLKSDFIMWAFTKVAGDQMLSFVGVPQELQQNMTMQEREDANRLIEMILPVSQRHAGIINDATNHQNRQRLPLENIQAPTIIIDAKDVETFPGSKYTAEHISNVKFVIFETGGHLLIGHADEARAVVSEFLQEHETLEIVR
jgi:2-hydroxy-6-oxonona-2,4-dienedioate hydrolase